ncbi:uncharacterized protein CG4449 [Chrysoperla carnea]|uniref:uncharacterized protein CG4449 n=1 Tax=Chrysoperla carnea TaxID=189513 RepID=UPI001D067D02|nr:uncharacterized protein CG4449 [Chrysoperla carnea]
MSSSEDEDFYSDPVKQLAKFNDVESNDEDDFEIKENVPVSPSPVKIAPKQRGRRSKQIKNDDLEILKTEVIKKGVRSKSRSKKSKVKEETLEVVKSQRPRRSRAKKTYVDEDDEDLDILEVISLSNRRRSTKRTRTAQSKSPKPRRGRKKRTRQQNSSIIILSDNEDSVQTNATQTEQIVSDVNFEHKIKVWWQCNELTEFKIRKYQKLQTIFDFYANREKIPLNRLIFLLNNKTIYPTDTPDMLKLERIHIIEGGCINEDVVDMVGGARESNNAASMIQLKVQLRDRKKPLHVFIKKTEPLSVLMAKCTEELECDIKKLRFEFDGDLLNPNDTPESLDFDGGECIDVFVK